MFAAWGRLVHRRRGAVFVLSGLLLAASAGIAALGNPAGANQVDAGTESGRAQGLLQAELPKSRGTSFSLLFSGGPLAATDDSFRQSVLDAVAPLRTDRRVTQVRTPYEVAGRVNRAMVSADGHQAVATVALADDATTALGYYKQLRGMVHAGPLRVTATGELAFQDEVYGTVNRDLARAESITLPFSLALLLVVFASLVAASLPVSVGVLAVVGGVAGTFLLARVTDVSPYALNIVSLIGLGVAIDYSLFVVNRFREELAAGRSTPEALEVTMATTGRAIAFSGLTVAIGLSGLLFFQGIFLASMGVAGAFVVLLAVVYALTFLPALLSLLGPRVNRLRLPLPRSRGTGWAALAGWVMRHPLLALLPALGLVLLAGSPFLHIRLAQAGITTLPPAAESRQTWETVKRQFPAQERTRVWVVTQFPGSPLTAERVGALYDLDRQVRALDGVLRVDSIVDLDPALTREDYLRMYSAPVASLPPGVRSAIRSTVGHDLAVLSVLTAADPTSDQARRLVRAIRTLGLAGGQVLVTGPTAIDLDAIDFMASRTPAAVTFVVVSTLVVLFLLLGTVVLPIKAVLMNALSITASFGALVWVFQDGHLAGLLGITPAPIDPTVPVLLFCIVFGLSMDYEVLMLTRMKEERAAGASNRQAVAAGLQRCGRLITGAAAIMVLVFSAFALADVVVVKAIGLGLAVAVAVDATLVRCLIVPASMRLLGDLNWWVPGRLGRWQRKLGLAEAAPSYLR